MRYCNYILGLNIYNAGVKSAASSTSKWYTSPLSRRITTDGLDGLDIQRSAGQVLFLESISQTLEVIGLEVAVERRLVVI